MKKSDIKMLDIVKLRGGNLCIVSRRGGKFSLYDPRIDVHVELLDHYSDDLINTNSLERDIVAVAKFFQVTAKDDVSMNEIKLWINSIKQGTFYDLFNFTWKRKDKKK